MKIIDVGQTDLIRKKKYWCRFECANYEGRQQEIRLYTKRNGYQTNRRFDINAIKKIGIQQIRDLSRVKKMGIERIVDQRKTDLTMKTMGEGNRRLDL